MSQSWSTFKKSLSERAGIGWGVAVPLVSETVNVCFLRPLSVDPVHAFLRGPVSRGKQSKPFELLGEDRVRVVRLWVHLFIGCLLSAYCMSGTVLMVGHVGVDISFYGTKFEESKDNEQNNN